MSELFEISIDVDDKTQREFYDDEHPGEILKDPNAVLTALFNVLKAISSRDLHVRSVGENSVGVTENGSPLVTIKAIKLVSVVYPDATFRVDIVGPMGYGDEYYEGVRFTNDTQANAEIKSDDVHNLLKTYGEFHTPIIEEEQ